MTRQGSGMTTQAITQLPQLYRELRGHELPADETLAGFAQSLAFMLRDVHDQDQSAAARANRIGTIARFWGCRPEWLQLWIGAYKALQENGSQLISWLETGATEPGPVFEELAVTPDPAAPLEDTQPGLTRARQAGVKGGHIHRRTTRAGGIRLGG